MPGPVVGRHPLAGALLLLILTGCGAVLTAGIAGGVLGLAGGKSGGGRVGPPTVGAASETANASSGTVAIDFTLSSPMAQSASVGVAYSTDGKTFSPASALSFTGPNGPVNASSVPASPSGIPYTFVWNSSRDLPAVLKPGVTLEILIDGTVAFTFAPILVDDTNVPAVSSVLLPSLPGGASVYADDQFGGSIPISVTVAQAQGNAVTLQVLYSTNGFATTNTAAGILTQLGNPTAPVSLSSVPAPATGATYTFSFDSSGNGLGTTTTQPLTLRFVAVENVSAGEVPKQSPPLDLALTVDNAFFTASLFLPAGTQVTDNVQVPFALFSAAQDPLVVSFSYSLDGGSSWQAATPITNEPPGDVTNPPGPLSSSPSGTNHVFIWNAWFDMLANGNSVASSSGVELSASVTNTRTGVVKGTSGSLIATPEFSVDQRLIYTIFDRNPAALNGVSPPTNARLIAPLGIAFAPIPQKLFFCDEGSNLVLVVDAPGTPQAKLNTAFGGGIESSPGSLAPNFALTFPTDVAAATDGTIYVTGSVQGQQTLFRVDGATPIVTFLDGAGVGATTSNLAARFVCLEPSQNGGKGLLYCVENEKLSGSTWSIIRSVTPDGSQPPATIAGGTTNPDVAGVSTAENAAATQASIKPLGIAANFNVVPGLVFFTDALSLPTPVVRALNVTTSPIEFCGVTVAGTSVATVVSTGLTANPAAPSIRIAIDPNSPTLYVSTNGAASAEIYDVVDGGNFAVVTSLVGTGTIGFAGDGGPPLLALCNPQFMASDGVGGLFFTDSTGRVRHEVPTPAPGTVSTVAGGLLNEGDGQPACAAQFSLPSAIAAVPGGFVVSELTSLVVRFVDGTSTIIQTVAGNGTSGIAPNVPPPPSPLPALGQPFGGPTGLASDPSGDVFVSQPEDSVVQELVPQAGGGYAVVRAAGSGLYGVPTDGMAATSQPLLASRALGFGSGCLVIPQSTTIAGQAPGFVSAVNMGNAASAPGITWGQTIPAGAIFRVAGALSGGAVVDSTTSGQIALNAGLPSPAGAAVSTKGEIYFCDSINDEVYRVDPSGHILLVAGNRFTTAPAANDGDGLAPTALGVKISAPQGVAILNTSVDVLYIYDSGNDRIRIANLDPTNPVTLHGMTINANTITTVAGSGKPPGANGNNDDGPATKGLLTLEGFVTSMVVQNGSLYFADQGAARIRVVDDAGTIRTFAGGGSLDGDAPAPGIPNASPGRTADNAGLTRPTALAVAPDGTYYVMDSGRIRVVDPNSTTVTRIAGTAFQESLGDGGPAIDASFEYRTENTAAPVVTSDFDGPRQIALAPLLAPSVGVLTSLILVADTMASEVRVVNTGGNMVMLGNGTIPLPAGGVVSLPQPPVSLDGPFGAHGTTDGLEGVAINSSGIVVVSDIKAGKFNLLVAYNLGNATQPLRCMDGTGTVQTTLAPGSWAALISATDTTVFGSLGGNRPANLAFLPGGGVLAFDLGNEPGITATTDNVWALAVSPGGNQSAFGRSLTPGTAVQITNGQFTRLRGIASDPTTSDLYVCDRGDPANLLGGATSAFVYRIRASDGDLIAVAGLGLEGFSGDGGLATQAELSYPFSLGVDGTGSVYVLDSGNARVRRLRKFP
ncbi:MAG TPA: hypothetical protein VFF73_24615 [Planctomycetota bacterium]|nr:hypothetical protein [Planctomycetota bacterium]